MGTGIDVTEKHEPKWALVCIVLVIIVIALMTTACTDTDYLEHQHQRWLCDINGVQMFVKQRELDRESRLIFGNRFHDDAEIAVGRYGRIECAKI